MDDKTINALAGGEPDPHDSLPFQPDWRLEPPDALATVLRIAMLRRGIEWGETLATDDQWHDMCAEIIDQMEHDEISPIWFVPQPRTWDGK